jgi:hypothetical protein
VGEGSGDGCEREPIGQGEACRKEEGAVSLVSLEVERGILVDDPGDVV